MRFWNQLFLNKVFFVALFVVATIFVFSFFFPSLFAFARISLFIVVLVLAIDISLIYSKKIGIIGKRELSERLSLSDINEVKINLDNLYSFPIEITIFDELPPQFRIFNFKMNGKIRAKEKQSFRYELTPKERGNFNYGKTIILARTPIKFVQRRFTLDTDRNIKVYPSYLRLNKYSLTNFKYYANDSGIKKTRKIGNSTEFEQIKDYVSGDDIRSLNWKATAKRGRFMVNQYVDEKSQQIYCVIDKGRSMKMPFNDMTLLDYSINSSLMLSNIVLKNQDRFGVFTFSKQIENMVKPERRSNQMNKVLEVLYGIETDFKESDFGMLYSSIKRKITHRSLMLLYTNFESLDSLRRQLSYLIQISKSHLLVVIFFQDTELENFINRSPKNNQETYEIAIAEKIIYEKRLIVKELNKHGIQTILTQPDNLTVDSINKYLEIKAKNQL